MKILWFTWKDGSHPEAGGAELINEEVAKRFVRDGHSVIFVVGGFGGCDQTEIRDGYTVVRIGNRYTVYWRAYLHYKKALQGWADLVIDEMNTLPFFCKFYVREPNILLAYQLCREIWFYQIGFPLNVIGYMVEPIYLWMLRDRYVITESESAKRDMGRFGFAARNIWVIPVAIKSRPVEDLASVKKYPQPTLLSLGAVRPMKRTLDQIEAFEIAKRRIPSLRLQIAGKAIDDYGQKVLARIAASEYSAAIEYLGPVDERQKVELMQKSALILVTSVKEGWGLIVTEANSQGTPAVVYDVDGLRDSVRNGETGCICAANSPRAMAELVVTALQDSGEYERLRENAWRWSQTLTFEQCYANFKQGIESGCGNLSFQ